MAVQPIRLFGDPVLRQRAIEVDDFDKEIRQLVTDLVNPTLQLSDETQDGAEGCLSLPDVTYDCLRALSVVATGFDMYGEPQRIEASELLARALQHETDHLDGILFIDKLDTAARKAAMKEIRESEWFGLEKPTVRVSPHATRGLAR